MHVNAISVTEVSKTFNSHLAVKDLSFQVPSGLVYGLLGPNGAGKTTTLRMMMDIYRPDQGNITILGHPPGKAVQHRIGYLPEERGLYRKMKVLEHLVFLGSLKNLSPKEARTRALGYLERFDLFAWKDHKVEQLSKGMQQKIQFIGTILHEPELLILDEPFSGLDPVNQKIMIDLLDEWKKRGHTILFSTHILPQAEKLCSHLCLIHRGQKVLEGSLASIKEGFRKNRCFIKTAKPFASAWRSQFSLQKHKDGWVVELPSELPPQKWLATLCQEGVEVIHFSPLEVSLDDIFLEVVKDDVQL